jgi:hypothetical protein
MIVTGTLALTLPSPPGEGKTAAVKDKAVRGGRSAAFLPAQKIRSCDYTT